MKVIAANRRARHNYKVIDSFEAGIELRGSEVKSLRSKGCSLAESFVRVEHMEAFIYNMHISEFEKSSYFSCDPKRVRKLLLRKQELKKLFGLVAQKGLTLIPLKVYFNDRGLVKVEVALARGVSRYDKRKKIKEEITNKEIQRSLKNHRTKL